ncbi:MAG: hypothetical protein LBT89_02310 [Planctomycetaceae bacterium]|nr:hypothetical protein [Planctomycetaceae bacterium]
MFAVRVKKLLELFPNRTIAVILFYTDFQDGEGIQDNDVSLSQQKAKTSLADKTRLCYTQQRIDSIGCGTSLLDELAVLRRSIFDAKAAEFYGELLR